MQKVSSTHFASIAAIGLSMLGTLGVLSGCATGALDTVSTPLSPVSNIEISGTVHGGATAISGATVRLWVSGTSAYGAGATQIGTSQPTTTGTGTFTISPSFATSSCSSPSTQIVYVTVSGGDPTGTTLTANNHAILLADVLGVCANFSASQKVSVNEATTVAAAYALSGFTKVTSSAGGFASLSIGAPSTNQQGLDDAAANAIALINPNTGITNSSTANVLLPTAALNSLANTATACVNASEYNAANCPTVLLLATPPNGTQPTNIYQALLNMAAYPGNNAAALLNAGTSFSLFQPTLSTTSVSSTTAPNDLSLAIAYPNSTLEAATAGPVALTIDSTDNVWVLGANNGTSNYVTELSNASTGSVSTNNLPASLASTQNVRWGAFDNTNSLWLSDGAALAVYNGGSTTPTAQSFSSLTPGGTATSLDPNNYVLAIDFAGNVFTATYGAQGNCVPNTVASATTVCDAIELPNGVAANATDQFGGNYVPTPSVRGIFADANQSLGTYRGNAWFTNYGVTSATKGATTTPGNTVEVLTPGTKANANTGTAGNVNTITVGPSGAGLWGIALDNTSSAYVLASTIPALYYVPATTANGATIANSVTANTFTNIPTGSSAPSASTVNPATGGLNLPANLALDGAGNVFISNTTLGTVSEYSPTLSGYVSPYFGFSPSIGVPTQTATVTKYAVASGVITVTANNTFTPGTVVTLSSSTVSALNGLTLTVSSATGLSFKATTSLPTTSSTSVTGTTAAAPASSQALLSCTPAGAPATCALTGQAVFAGPGVVVDRAGSVWTLSVNGTLQAMIGTAAPTNPVLAAGSYGVTP